jgi:SAM-dependent methyltransferase
MPKTQEIPVCGLDGRCMRFKHFYPLLAFLIPTTLIGYGVVIPRSCIAGVNQLSVGFASTLLGTVIAYWQGIRIALRKKTEVREKDNAAIWIHRAAGKSGLNLPFYSSEVQHVVGVEPSLALPEMAAKRAATGHTRVNFLLQSADEPLPLPDESIDTIVMTWTLCSIPNAPKALAEMKRVLKPDGRLLFIEHGRAPEPSVVAWQDRLTPIWKQIGGGCHLNRKIDELITAAGFQIGGLKTYYLPGPRPMTYTFQGFAEPMQRD